MAVEPPTASLAHPGNAPPIASATTLARDCYAFMSVACTAPEGVETTADYLGCFDAVFSEESTMTIDKPLVGFYYSFKQGGDVSVGDQADLNKLGGRDIISFELTKGPLQYFYQTLVTPTALPAK